MADLPPHDSAAEQALLGTLIQFPGTIPEGSVRVAAGDFFHPQNRLVYEAVLRLFNEGNPVSPSSVLSELGRAGSLNKVGASYLADLIQMPTTADSVGYYAGVVAGKSRLRRIKALAVNLEHATELDADDAVAAVHRFLDEAEVEDAPGADDFDAAYESWVNWYDTSSVAVPTPWPGINQALLGGLHRGRLYTVAGRPGAGKSAFGLNVILRAAMSGYRSVVFSLEMPREECMARIISAGSRVPLKSIFTHRLSAEERSRVESFATNYTRPNLLRINDSPSQTIESIMASCRAAKQRDGLDVVAIDHSLLLDPSDRRQALYQQVTHIAKQAKLLARRLDIAVVLLHQLNRNDQDGRRPQMKDLREGGEMDSDVIIILGRDESQVIRAHIVKNRMGKANVSVDLADELSYGKLGNGAA